MSCRVLGRKVEHMVLREILKHARAAGIQKLIGTYRPTDHNSLVIDHYANLGFTKVAENESGTTYWILEVSKADPEDAPRHAPMKVISQVLTTLAREIIYMNESDMQNKGDLAELKLPRRDWILLPLICLLTICLIAGSAEIIGTWMFPRAGNSSCRPASP